jgi:N-acetylglucosaminyldiphosphoundecaprenol N-acetyl-beta-D-mannosaminyltransferase
MAKARQSGWRVFYLGGEPGVAERAAEVLRGEFPGLQIATHHGYFTLNGEGNRGVLKAIADCSPQVLMVGMGMPRQEHWVVDNLEHIRADAILTAGACFDYVAGAIPTPPRWMGRVGLEWLYRLSAEPGRLWRRYLLEPWSLLRPAVRDVVHRLRYKGRA